MGKVIFLIFFVGAFVVFVVIKAVFFGVKEAYKAVFDPNSDDEKIQQVIATCALDVNKAMLKRYSGDPETLSRIIIKFAPIVQSRILKNGYQVSCDVAESIVKKSIVLSGHATEEEVERA